jgi:hypothetical protein
MGHCLCRADIPFFDHRLHMSTIRTKHLTFIKNFDGGTGHWAFGLGTQHLTLPSPTFMNFIKLHPARIACLFYHFNFPHFCHIFVIKSINLAIFILLVISAKLLSFANL